MKAFLAILLSGFAAFGQGFGPQSVTQAGFSPLTITNCALWLDAAQVQGTNTQTFAAWPDSSYHSYAGTNNTASQQPSVRSGIINGRDGFRFDGVDDILLLNGGHSMLRQVSGATIFCVAIDLAPTSGDANHVTIGISTGAGVSTSRAVLGTRIASNPVYGIFARRTDADTASSPTLSSVSNAILHQQTGVYDFSGNAAYLRVRGNQSSTTAFSSGGGLSSNTDSIGIGVGGFVQANNRFNGYIAEVLVFNRALGASEIAVIEQYLSRKWGVPFQ